MNQELKSKLTRIIEQYCNAAVIDIVYETLEKGTTLAAQKINVQFRDRPPTSFIVKSGMGQDFMNFYKNVLVPYDLKHPSVIAAFNSVENDYILMPFIEQSTAKWQELDFLKVIDWIVSKDSILRQSLVDLDQYESYTNILEEMLPNLKMLLLKARAYKLFKPISMSTEGQLDEAVVDLEAKVKASKGNEQTLLHQDLGKRNVLRSKGEIFVIDWQKPRVGNPLFDLSKFLVGKEPGLVEMLTQYYISKVGYPVSAEMVHRFINIQNAAYLHWYLEAYFSGRSNLYDEEHVIELFQTLINI